MGRWARGLVRPFLALLDTPSPAQYEILSRLRTGAGATDWLLGLRFWRSSSGDGSVLFPQYISGTLTSLTLLNHNWLATSDRQYDCWSTSRQLECFTPHHWMDGYYDQYSSATEVTILIKSSRMASPQPRGSYERRSLFRREKLAVTDTLPALQLVSCIIGRLSSRSEECCVLYGALSIEPGCLPAGM